MWQILVLIIIALVAIKIFKVYFFWSNKGIPHENLFHSWYKVLVTYNCNSMSQAIIDEVNHYGDVYGTFRGFTPTLVFTDPEIAKEVLIKQFGNFYKRTFEFTTGDPLWDNTLTHLPYDEWKGVRTIMGYTFTSAKMRAMIPKLDKVAKRVVSKVSDKTGQDILLAEYCRNYGMDSISAIAFGLDLNCIDNPHNRFVKEASNIFQPFEMMLFLLMPNFIKYLPFVRFPRKSTSDFFGSLIKQIIAEKKLNLDERIDNGTADIIDHHLISQRDDPKSVLTDEMLASQAFLFFIGGLDVTVVTLELSTYYLAVSPEVQERVYEEIKHVLGERTDIGYGDLQKMKLVEGCLLETLRVSPLASMIDRICTKETVVEGHKIEPGMIVQFPVSAMHHNPQYFPEPEEFRPERFVQGEAEGQNLSAFLTFGDGPKNCIGRRLATMNMQLLLANLLLNFRIDRTEKTPVPLRPRPGLRFTDLSMDPLFIKFVPRAQEATPVIASEVL